MTLDEFFEGFDQSREIFGSLQKTVISIGPATIKVSKSQIAFVRSRIFARVWIPERHLGRKAAPLVLTLGFRYRDASPRWKEIVEPAKGRFTHHLELYAPSELDSEVKEWLRAAWENAG